VQLLSRCSTAAEKRTLVFGKTTAAAPEAAWINAAAAHALDFDDVALRGHPSAGWFPPYSLRRRQSARQAGK